MATNDHNSETFDFPLAGIKIVEMTDGKGESCGRFLADLGAEVILVEPPAGNEARHAKPLHGDVSLHFATHNANKRSVTLDITTATGQDRLLALLSAADVFIEGTKPDTLSPLGFDGASLRERLPHLIILSYTDFGQTGPYRDFEATSAILYAMGAVLARSGIEGNRPLLPPGNLPYEATSIQAAWVTLLAWWQRSHNGKGNYLDFSCFEATAQILDPGLGVTGSAAAGRSAGELAPYGRPPVGIMYPIFACADGHVRICVLNPRQWMGMSGWLGDDHPYTDPKYANIAVRRKELPAINALIAELFHDKRCADLVAEGQKRGVPIAAVATAEQVLNDEHFNARGAFTSLDVAPGVSGKVPSGYLEIDGQRIGIRSGAPAKGQDTDKVFANLEPFDSSSLPTASASRRPLEGIRVLDLGVIVAGAELGRLFADQGADVIKVENVAFSDGLRQSSLTGIAISQSFAQGSRNKKSFGLNLRSEKGIAIFKELVAKSDAVFSNFKPGTLESLGIDYDTLKAINPGIVVVESSALGNTGPLAKSMGYGPLVRASAGITGLWRYPEIEGSYSDSITILPDHFAARVAAVGVLAAFIRRQKTGIGAKVVISQAETMLTALSTEFLRESLQPGTLYARGNQYEFDAPNSVFPCAGDDEWCVIAVHSDQQWLNLVETVGMEGLRNPGFATAQARVEHRAEIEGMVAEWTQTLSPTEVMNRLQQAGVPAGKMQRLQDFDSDPHLKARNFFRQFEQPGFPTVLQTENNPVSFSDFPEPVINPAPFQAQHTRVIARDLLGMDEATVDALIASGDLEDMNEEYSQYLQG